MRDEMLKRLDEIMNEATDPLDAGFNRGWCAQEWVKLRTTLAAERCENCQYAGVTYESDERGWLVCRGLNLSDKGGASLCCESSARLLVSPGFCCAHFEARP
jgi:hypothetical protein